MNGSQDRVRLYAETDIPRYLRRGYDVAEDFALRHVDDQFPKELIILFGEPHEIEGYTGRLDVGRDFQTFRKIGVLYRPEMQDLVEKHADREGSIAIDRRGQLLGTEVSLEMNPAEFAVLYGMDMVTVSGETGRVSPFWHGAVVERPVIYNPFGTEKKEVA